MVHSEETSPGQRGPPCAACKQDMRGACRSGCTPEKVHAADRIPFIGPGATCRDCGVVAGGRHRLGCDSEICPICGKQLLIDEEHNPFFATYPAESQELMRDIDRANMPRKPGEG